MTSIPKSQYVSWKFRLVARHNVVVPFKADEFNVVYRETLKKVTVWWIINSFLVMTIGIYLALSLGYLTISDPRLVSIISYLAYVSGAVIVMALLLALMVGITRFVSYVFGVFKSKP